MSAYLEIDWTKVAVFGECTTSPDPDGRFLVVVMRDGPVHSWPSAQCEQSVVPLVERATGVKVEYVGHFGMLPASRVMFPVGLVDQPLLDFCPAPGKGRVAWTMEPFREHAVLTHGIGLSDEVEAYLQALAAAPDVDWSQVAVFGECVTDSGPDVDDYFLVAVMRSGRVLCWPHGSAAEQVAPALERSTGGQVRFELFQRTDRASRVMFPSAMAGQPLLDFEVNPAQPDAAVLPGFLTPRGVVSLGVKPSGQVLAYLESLVPLKPGEVSLRAYLAIVACAHELPVLVECVSKGRMDEMEAAIALELLLERVCMAWNSRRLNPEAVDEETEQGYADLTDRVPPLIPGLRLQPTLWGEELFDPKEPCAYVRRRWYLPWTWDVRRNQTLPMLDELRLAAVAASRLKARTAWPDEELRTALAEILRHLNLAWHFRWRSEAAVGRLTSTQKDDLGRTIPGFFMLGSKRLETEG